MTSTDTPHTPHPLRPRPWRPPGETVNASKAAKLLGCNPKHIAQLCEEGKLHGFKYTGRKQAHWTILRDSVVRYSYRLREQAGLEPEPPRTAR